MLQGNSTTLGFLLREHARTSKNLDNFSACTSIFNAAQPGVGRVQVLGSKNFLQKEPLDQSLVSFIKSLSVVVCRAFQAEA